MNRVISNILTIGHPEVWPRFVRRLKRDRIALNTAVYPTKNIDPDNLPRYTIYDALIHDQADKQDSISGGFQWSVSPYAWSDKGL